MAFTDVQEIFEFRGVDNLMVAEVTKDDATEYTAGTPETLSYIAEVGKSTETSSESKYYDNQPMLVINSEGADEITLTIAPPSLRMQAWLTGKSFDETTGMMVDGERVNRYFAIMYRTKGTDGKYRYVSRLKGTFGIPEETTATEDDGTDSNNMELTFTGISTSHKFTHGKMITAGNWEKGAAKGVVVDERYALADVSKFFESVQTPDTVTAKDTPPSP